MQVQEGPQEAGELTSAGDHDLLHGQTTTQQQPAVAAVQALLSPVRQGDHRRRLAGPPLSQCRSDTWPVPAMVGRLGHQPTQVTIARLGDPAPAHTRSTRNTCRVTDRAWSDTPHGDTARARTGTALLIRCSRCRRSSGPYEDMTRFSRTEAP